MFGAGVETEICPVEVGLEIIPVLEAEVGYGVDLRVVAHPVVHVIEDDEFFQQALGDVILAQHVDLDVRRHAAAAEDGAAAAGFKLGPLVVGDVVGFSVAVFNGLDAPVAGDVVFGRRDLDAAAVPRFHDVLHQPLAVAPLPDEDAAVEVLQRPGDDLGGRGGAAVDQYRDRQLGIQGIALGGVAAVPVAHLALGGYD